MHLKSIKTGIALLLGLITLESAQAQFTISANYRARSEFRDGSRILLSDSLKPTWVSSQRTRLITDYKMDKFEFRFAVQNARIWGDDKERANVPNMNLNEGWIRYQFDSAFAIKIGRQEMVLDDGRIFGRRNWNDIAVTHDLAVLEYANNGLSAKLGGAFNDDGNKYTKSAYNVNYYKYLAFLWINKELSENAQVSLLNSIDGNEDAADFTKTYGRVTSGLYTKIKSGAFGVEASGYYQYGKSPDGLDQSAFMFSIVPEYKVNDLLKLKGGVNYFSGNDRVSGDTSKNQAFNKLFGDGHRYYGYMDYFLNIESNTKGTGVREFFIGTYFKLSKKTDLEVSYHNFATTGTQIDPTVTTEVKAADKALGNEFDIQLKHKINEFFSFRFAYANMFATESMEILKGGDHTRYQQWATVMLIAKPTLFTTKK